MPSPVDEILPLDWQQPPAGEGDYVLSINPTHQYLSLWMIANPGATKKQLAESLGRSPGWVSEITNSDMFLSFHQAMCARYNAVAVGSLADKTRAACEEAVEALRAKLQQAPSEQFILGAAKTLLTATGFGAPKVETVQRHIHAHVDLETLQRARAKAAARFQVEQVPSAVPVELEGSLA